MASFDFATCEIRMTAGAGGYGGTKADLDRIPIDADATISFSHEYVHYLQLISSVMGLHMIGELVNLGVAGAFALEGHSEGAKPPRTAIVPLLRKYPDHAGNKLPFVAERVRHLWEQVRVLFFPNEYAYSGTKAHWECDEQTVTDGQYTETLFGFVTPRGTFRPFSPGMLAEGIARRTDQWLKRNMGFTGHAWGSGVVEREFYNGVREILSQPRYAENVASVNLDRVTVVVCWLALATARPDKAMRIMLECLEGPVTAGGTVDAIALELKDQLRRSQNPDCQPRAGAYNEVIQDLQTGAASAMDHKERYAVVEHLQKVASAANVVISDPAYYADERIDWGWVRLWMTQYAVPPVVAEDGEVADIDGVPCVGTITELLKEIWRVMT